MDLGLASFDVEIKLVFKVNPEFAYKANGKLSACPFCRCQDGTRDSCTLCGGSGVLILLPPKIKLPAKIKLTIIKGGKK